MNQARARKLGDRIAKIVAEMLERRIKDPRLGFVTVTEARATGLIRSEVGKQTGLKHTPSISFSQDTIPDTARTIEDLVAKARAADARVAAVRADAVPAGDPDPYRTPDAEDGAEDATEDDDDL